MKTVGALFEDFRAGWEASPEHTCDVCGSTWRGREHPLCWECQQEADRREQARRRAESTLAGLDPRWQGVTLASYECPPGDAAARDAVRAWDGSRGIYLHGAPGSGKSHLAFARVRALLDEGRHVFVCEWSDLLRRIRATYSGQGPETEASILAEMNRADLVFIDDLLTARPTEWAIDQLWAIVQALYQSQRPLLVTCNYSLGELTGRIGATEGARIVSRLAEMTQRVEVRARDFRLGGST